MNARKGLAIAAVITVPASVIAGWTIMASRLFVAMGGLGDFFPTPWVTWWRYAMRGRPDGSTMLYLVLSAILAAIPIIALIVLGIAITRRVQKVRAQALYGRTGWASRNHMARRDIRHEAEPF